MLLRLVLLALGAATVCARYETIHNFEYTSRIRTFRHSPRVKQRRFLFCLSGSDERPEVHTSLGKLQGVWMTSELGSRYAAYLGVPFAQPPLGKLRFKVRTHFCLQYLKVFVQDFYLKKRNLCDNFKIKTMKICIIYTQMAHD